MVPLRHISIALWASFLFLGGAEDSALFAQEGIYSGPSFCIQQDSSRENGVLVSKPNRSDIQIRDFVLNADIKSIEDYANWLNHNIEYRKSHQFDAWVLPSDILRRRWGDCEDFALLNSAVLRVLGYQPRFLALQRARRAHAICTFQKDGAFFWFDNADIKNARATTLQDFVQLLKKQYHLSRVLELDLSTMQWARIDTPT
ncbi:MAG TPA: transglutaminase-like domain-containing protein [Candidatus Omnitrophota bacterium]|nr:transglutaminase-like domain-containing protein [Candidatus Omnitrophota bacterium]